MSAEPAVDPSASWSPGCVCAWSCEMALLHQHPANDTDQHRVGEQPNEYGVRHVRKRIEFGVADLVGSAYSELLTAARWFASMFGLVMTLPTCTDSPLVALLRPWLLGTREVSEYPGTTLMRGHSARVAYYEYTGAVADLLDRHTTGMPEWQYPGIPDDPHWLRADRTARLVSGCCTSWAWLEMSAERDPRSARRVS